MKHVLYLYTDGSYPFWLSNKVTSFMNGFGEAMFYIIFHRKLLNSYLFVKDSVPGSYLSLHYIQKL
jgi:hypothetical protein